MCFLPTPKRRGTLEANFDTNSHPGKVHGGVTVGQMHCRIKREQISVRMLTLQISIAQPAKVIHFTGF